MFSIHTSAGSKNDTESPAPNPIYVELYVPQSLVNVSFSSLRTLHWLDLWGEARLIGVKGVSTPNKSPVLQSEILGHKGCILIDNDVMH